MGFQEKRIMKGRSDMTPKNEAHPWLADMTEAAIEHHLGDISDFPETLKSRITNVYMPFVDGYINFLRQKDNQAPDWVPPKWAFDSELADDMRHFFSDYQHIVNAETSQPSQY